jgi:phage tail-like protein
MPIPVPDGEDGFQPFPGFAFYVNFAAHADNQTGGGSGTGFQGMGTVAPEVSGAFQEVSGLEAMMEPKVIKEGGRNYGAVQRPGGVTFATVILKRGIIEVRHLWRWWSFFAGADGAKNGGWAPTGRCDVSIALIRIALKEDLADHIQSGHRIPILGWRLENAMPIKYRVADLNARGTEVAIEELHLAHEGLHMTGVGKDDPQ